jgi:hypothetical protein
MRAPFLRAIAFAALTLIFAASQFTPASAQQPVPRIVALTVPPEIHTELKRSGDAWRDARDRLLLDRNALRTQRQDRCRCRDERPYEDTRPGTARAGARRGRESLRGVSFLDLEEIDGCHARVIDGRSDAKWTGHDDRRATDLSFTSTGGLRVDVHQSGRVQRIFLSTGTADPITTSFDVSDIYTLKQAFDQGLALLNSK